MEDFGIERTLSTPERRTLILAGCAVLGVGVGLGVLIGRLTARPEPPPVSASILPDYAGRPDGNTTIGNTTIGNPTIGSGPAPEASPPASALATPPGPGLADPRPADLPSLNPPAAVPPAPAVVAPQTAHRPAHAKTAEAKPRPALRRDSKPAAKMAAKPTGPARQAAASSAPGQGARWVVQLGAFRSAEHANLLVNTLAVHGQPAEVRFSKGWFYVQTPPYRTAHAAKGAAEALAAREHLPTYLIKLPAAAG